MQISERLNGHLNGTAKKARKPAKRKDDHLQQYATVGVVLMSILSALLNGYANSLHAGIPWIAWVIGVVIPAIVLILGKVASLLHKRRKRQLALATGITGTTLLFLSVWHCATAIALLTGSPLFLAFPLAIAIDCGLVCCELAAIL